MKTYGFYVVLAQRELSDRDCDALFESGCDDATIVTRDRMTRLAFDREADSLEQALNSATANVRAAGFEVAGIEMDAPLTAAKAG